MQVEFKKNVQQNELNTSVNLRFQNRAKQREEFYNSLKNSTGAKLTRINTKKIE